MHQDRRLPRDEFELLSALVEAARNVPPDESNSFVVVQQDATTLLALTHLSRDIPVSRRTLEHLVRMQLVKYDIKDGAERFTVTDKGFAYYDQIPQHP